MAPVRKMRTLILSPCECWTVTFSVNKTTNPSKTSFVFEFNLLGLGSQNTSVAGVTKTLGFFRQSWAEEHSADCSAVKLGFEHGEVVVESAFASVFFFFVPDQGIEGVLNRNTG